MIRRWVISPSNTGLYWPSTGGPIRSNSATSSAQAASFAAYVTGKTADEVAGIAVDAGTKPTEADLVSSVTIAVGGFQALIAKACQ